MSEIKFNIYIKTIINLHIYKLKCQLRYKSSIIFNTSYNIETNQWNIAQCKNYKGTITIDKLAGFYDLVLSTSLSGELYYTSRLSEPITRYRKSMIKFIIHPFINNNDVDIAYTKLVPRDYQIDAINKLKLHKRSILHLPCGMGKTLIAIKWSDRFDIIIIFSPLKQHAQQNLERFKNELNNYDKYILVDSDGDRNVDNIKKWINKKLILSVCYKSVDVISELIEHIGKNKKVGIIIDEFHNLTYDNIFDKNDIFYKVLVKDFNYLFVSATPRIFDLDDDYANNELITGKIEYTYEFGKAIIDGYICDYDVYVPNVSISKNDLLKGVYEHLKITDNININEDAKAHFLIRCMEENGHSKCICYSKDISDAQNLMNSINKIKEYHALDIYIKLLVSDTTKKERDTILSEFQETHTKAILCSVRILDECIDIPKCDSVFMTSAQTNKMRMIQRICRANRKNPENTNKKSGIYMWTDEYNQLTELVASLKEIDSSFTKEKIKLCDVANEQKSCVIDRKTNKEDNEYISIDKIVIGINRVDSWGEKLQNIKKYIDEHKCKPNIDIVDANIRSMAQWISDQNKNFKKEQKIMKSEETRNRWKNFIDEYSEYFKSNKETWNDTLIKVKTYIDENKCRPPTTSIDPQIKSMGKWITQQTENYNDKKNIMKIDDIYNKWGEFVTQYYDYFKSNEEEWNDSLNELQNYFDKYGYKPAEKTGSEEHKSLRLWLNVQIRNCKDENNRLQIMKSDIIYNKWCIFIEKNKDVLNKKLIKTHSIKRIQPKTIIEDNKTNIIIEDKTQNKVVAGDESKTNTVNNKKPKTIIVKGKTPKIEDVDEVESTSIIINTKKPKTIIVKGKIQKKEIVYNDELLE